MKKTAIIFITDGGYLVPSLVVCKQLLAQSAHEIADVFIYLVDVQESIRLQLEEAFKSTGIIFEPLTSKSFMPTDDMYFHKNHVPAVSLARLILNDVIPKHYENLIYLDGDTQIVGNVAPLINYVVPEGKIAAVRESFWLTEQPAPKFVDYLNGLDVTPEQYFNAGVLAFRRETWSEIAPKALKFFFENSAKCLCHDQSALNAVCKESTVYMQPAYNFQYPYATLYVQYSYKPAIIHFNGTNKPWKHEGLPWGSRFMHTYVQLLEELPFLKPLLKVSEPISLSQKTCLFTNDILGTLRYPRSFFTKRARFFDYVKRDDLAF